MENEIAFDVYIEEQTSRYNSWLDSAVHTQGITLDSLFESMHAGMWAAAGDQWGSMPAVCDEGQPCRDEIWFGLEA